MSFSWEPLGRHYLHGYLCPPTIRQGVSRTTQVGRVQIPPDTTGPLQPSRGNLKTVRLRRRVPMFYDFKGKSKGEPLCNCGVQILEKDEPTKLSSLWCSQNPPPTTAEKGKGRAKSSPARKGFPPIRGLEAGGCVPICPLRETGAQTRHQ